jgi:hypothetical protein
MDYVFLGLIDLTILRNPHAHYGWELTFMETIMVWNPGGGGVVGFKSDTGILLFMDEKFCNQLVDG